MLFNSFPFLFAFLPVVLVGFHLLGRLGRTAALGWLSAASLVFYAYWNKAFLLLLLGSILFNFLCGQAIAASGAREARQRILLWAGVTGNLFLLCYHKYWFPLLNSFGSVAHPPRYFGSVILPLGISFFTLTQIAYLVDLQQGEASVLGFLDHLFFVSFFPHLIAGPILHHREFMPQVTKTRAFRLEWNDLAVGSTWFVIGLFKKVVIADQIASYADLLFATPDGQPLVRVWCGVLSYAVQLYFDFSGYSDMAIGLARMFSLRFPLNFNSPYKAKSIIEFWQRWHMTLTNFLMLYIYNPLALAINRRRLAAGQPIGRKAVLTSEGFLRIIALPTLVTMVIAGVWHGAGRQFLAFGLLHGIFICINHAWRTFKPRWGNWLDAGRLGATVSVLITFLAVITAQVFFRADSIEDAFAVLRGAIGVNGTGSLPHTWAALFPWVALALLFTVIWSFPNTQEILGQYSGDADQKAQRPRSMASLQWQPTWGWGCLIGAAFFASFVLLKTASRFLYFQF
ncbi:MAG TPA: MBOAT family O-acyltransferase [Candidatus Angelobacter sp.]|nr:MBOAT family O-acyltransferase [Candidatus Angelobacter sp.]